MGLEAKCVATYKGRSGQGTALLESEGILYRGAFRLFIPAEDLKSAKVENGSLMVCVGGEVANLELGTNAEKWLHRILHPKTLIEKLGVKPGQDISVAGTFDANFEEQLKSTAAKVTFGKLAAGSDMIFYSAEGKHDLRGLSAAKTALTARGTIWIIYPKAVERIKENDVNTAAKKAGLVANKVVSFSKSHTGLRFVVPAT